MTLDDLLADAARIAAGADPRTVLAGSLVAQQIAADAAADRFTAWGRSTVIDENTGIPVITPALFAELHRLAAIPATWPVGNAGLIHVYGYLYSTTETPYGLKRDRWTKGGVALALGLAPDALTPWFAGETTPLGRLQRAMSPAFAAPEDAPGAVFAMQESAEQLTTTTILLRRRGTRHSALLYAVDDTLLTAFPFEISPSGIDALLSEAPRLRYNAVVHRAQQPLDIRRVLLHAALGADPTQGGRRRSRQSS